MEEMCIRVGGHRYLPQLLPVDYGSGVVCRLSLHLENGEYLECSTLQAGTDDLELALAETLHSLEEQCRRRYAAEGLLPKAQYRREPLA